MPLEAFINSFLLVFAGEMGDKTQLLSLILAARYRKPWTILAGVLVATLINHALAAWLGEIAAAWIPAHLLKVTLSVLFFIFAVWILIPDKEEEINPKGHLGVFMTTALLFFMAEMGDKTQLATIALGAAYSDVVAVTMGTTLGMLGSNALAIFMGDSILKRVPMKYVRIFACALFVAFGIALLLHR